MPKSDTPLSDALLVKYLNEAYGKEKQLEVALQAQIALASRPVLVKGLKDHLKVTKGHARGLQQRIKQLGGTASAGPDVPGPAVLGGAAAVVAGAANQAVAAAKGPVQALRGTSEADNELRNVRDCYWNEAEEIAHYLVIESAADALGDKETAKLARANRRDEEKMQRLLERQFAPLVKAVAREEVPSAERRSGRPASRRRAKPASASAAKPAAKSAAKTATRRTAKPATTRRTAATKRRAG